MDNDNRMHFLYVEAALRLQGIVLDVQQVAAVAQQFSLLAGMARTYMAEPLPAELESAAVYQL